MKEDIEGEVEASASPAKKKLRHGLAEPPPDPQDGAASNLPAAVIEELDTFLLECCRIDPLQLNEEFIRIPSDLAHWNARYAKALKRYLLAKVNEKITKGRLEPMMRQAIMHAGGKPTEKQIDALIDSNQSYIDICYELVDAEVEKNDIYGSLDAIRSKKEMLVSLGAHMRAEMGHDPLLRDQVRGARGERG